MGIKFSCYIMKETIKLRTLKQGDCFMTHSHPSVYMVINNWRLTPDDGCTYDVVDLKTGGLSSMNKDITSVIPVTITAEAKEN